MACVRTEELEAQSGRDIPPDIRQDPARYESYVRDRFQESLARPDTDLSRRAESLITRCTRDSPIPPVHMVILRSARNQHPALDQPGCVLPRSNNALNSRGGKAGFLERLRRGAVPMRSTSTRVKVSVQLHECTHSHPRRLPTVPLLPFHCYRSTATVPRLPYHCYRSTATVVGN